MKFIKSYKIFESKIIDPYNEENWGDESTSSLKKYVEYLINVLPIQDGDTYWQLKRFYETGTCKFIYADDPIEVKIENIKDMGDMISRDLNIPLLTYEDF